MGGGVLRIETNKIKQKYISQLVYLSVFTTTPFLLSIKTKRLMEITYTPFKHHVLDVFTDCPNAGRR